MASSFSRAGASASRWRPGDGRRRLGIAAACAAISLASGCDGPSAPTPTQGPPPARGPAAAAPLALTAGPSAPAHDLYAANGIGCAACHPCGTRRPDGHAAAWMDPASAQFHAYSANAGLAACQGCHGANLDGVGGTVAVSCASCHGANWQTSCVLCHGGTDSATGAPPRTTWGQTGDPVRVGAHTAHLAASHGLSPPVACSACHLVPASALSAGHVDGPTATVTFSGLAVSSAGAPSWDRAQATCASTYCHGATLAGGRQGTPVWTALDGSQRACDSCHGAPPPAPHPAQGACGTCHPGYTATTVAAATHVDGTLDVSLTCTSCHGQAGQAATPSSPLLAAPPVDASGASTGIRVGAHQEHLLGGAYSNGFACQTCHASVGSYALGHSDGVRQVGFAGAANANLARGTWNPGGSAAGTCSATWCHGAVISRSGGPSGGTMTAPAWTGNITSCTACHSTSLRSLPGRHEDHSGEAQCSDCHGVGYSTTAVVKSLHVNGVKDLGNRVRTWDGSSCTNTCHERERW